ncbi:AAA family ATPase [Rhodococcus hoagii]|uniref:AAA family ATPase n=1 Tax=Rhodococcus hoagii TaxID=43767 RepID=A0A9Q4ZIK3_RHOHA|nr:AAA family ATPase [Prescottella equi]MBM4708672.1 AAA family ATPase [Prescottella equi]NKT77299.1 AAA family ATPase [Prescottella equi]NKZ81086.1 AAA family ATPase [Prescottella equi]
MATLKITRGYPGSGKTTWAIEQVGAVPISRDDLRRALFNKMHGLTSEQEGQVTKAQLAQVTALLQAGIDVVVHDTNLRLNVARDFADLAAKVGADFACVDFRLSAEECIERDQFRFEHGGRAVGGKVIRRMAQRYPISDWQPVTPRLIDTAGFKPYEPHVDLPPLILFDIDGTVANHHGVRNPYDFSKVGLDQPIWHVIHTIGDLATTAGADIIAFSGRDDSCYASTREWLAKHSIGPVELHMRKTGDKRPDNIVKYEMFNDHIRDQWNVIAVFDDRLQVCRMWHQVGLPLYRVGDPDSNF